MCKFLYFVINFLKHGSQVCYSGKISSVVKMLPAGVPGLPRNRNGWKPRQVIWTRLPRGPCGRMGSRVAGSRGEPAPALQGREGCVQAAGWPWWSAHPVGGYSAWRMRSGLLLLGTPGFFSLLFRSSPRGFWSFCILLSIVCPNCTSAQLFLVLYSFFLFCC